MPTNNDRIALAVADHTNVRIKRDFVHGPIKVKAGLYEVCDKCTGTGVSVISSQLCEGCYGTGLGLEVSD